MAQEPIEDAAPADFPWHAEEKVDVLAELVNELLAKLVNDGRMSRAEERVWRTATTAVVLDRPDLLQWGGEVIAEAEEITLAAALRDD
ncbi:hypothetical protein OG979_17495 [Actinomadura citrea]|uniref:hypothetical protein n=1 Tax=Actinomadura citrea TaxID=46158 RepID=UPI002E27E5FB|nr:hypothetical protein [Actinomadura citrea]